MIVLIPTSNNRMEQKDDQPYKKIIEITERNKKTMKKRIMRYKSLNFTKL